LLRSLAAMARQYIEAMLATRWAKPDALVAVVDDEMTTGSTAAEVARVLKQAGAATVEVWVLARTPRPEDV